MLAKSSFGFGDVMDGRRVGNATAGTSVGGNYRYRMSSFSASGITKALARPLWFIAQIPTFTPQKRYGGTCTYQESSEARHDRAPAGKTGTLLLENGEHICRYFVPFLTFTLASSQSRRPQGQLHEKVQPLWDQARTALAFIGAAWRIRYISGHHTAPIKQALLFQRLSLAFTQDEAPYRDREPPFLNKARS